MGNRKLSPEGRYRAARRSLRASESEVAKLRAEDERLWQRIVKIESELLLLKQPAEERARLRLDEPRTRLLHSGNNDEILRDLFVRRGAPPTPICRRCGIAIPTDSLLFFSVLQDGDLWSQPTSWIGETRYWHGSEPVADCAPKAVDDLADVLAAQFGGYNPFRDGEQKRRPPQNLLDPDVAKWRYVAAEALRRTTDKRIQWP